MLEADLEREVLDRFALFVRSELAALLYCDELVDGSGHPLKTDEISVTLDRSVSVSGLDEDEDL